MRNHTRILAACLAIIMSSSDTKADVIPVDSADVTDFVLNSFVADGRTFTQADLIQPTLTAFAGYNDRNIAVTVGGSAPAIGTRSQLMTDDFRLDTGVINFAVGDSVATISFASPLINGPGPDLVFFEMQNEDVFQVRINSTTIVVGKDSYGPDVVDGAGAFDTFARDAGTPSTIEELENSVYRLDRTWEGGFNGVAFDLDDFGVAPFASVTDVHFGSFHVPGSMAEVDAGLFMGINSVPEPSAFVLMAIAGLAVVGHWYRRRRAT